MNADLALPRDKLCCNRKIGICERSQNACVMRLRPFRSLAGRQSVSVRARGDSGPTELRRTRPSRRSRCIPGRKKIAAQRFKDEVFDK